MTRAGLLYAFARWDKTGARFHYLMRSRDGGLTWPLVAHYMDRLYTLYGGDFLWDSHDRFIGGRLPGVVSEVMGPWNADPIDPSTLYVAQKGQGLLYRSVDIGTGVWDELSQGLDPSLIVRGVTVDSSATIYLSTTQGYWRKAGQSRPYHLDQVWIEPEMVHAGEEVALRARPVTNAARRLDGNDFEIKVFLGGQEVILRDAIGDGVYEASMKIPEDIGVGFHAATFDLQHQFNPLGDASRRTTVMVVPQDPHPIFRDDIAVSWGIELEEGEMDTKSIPALSGEWAHRIDGRATYSFNGTPINPFGYRLEFAVHGEGWEDLLINDQSLDDMAAQIGMTTKSDWVAVSIAGERLRATPPTLIGPITFASIGPVSLDEIALVPILGGDDGATAIEASSEVLPGLTKLHQNFPNPLNNGTVLRFTLAQSVDVELSIHNLAGQKVTTLVSGPRAAGEHDVFWNGRDDRGGALATGMYLCRLRSSDGGVVQTRKLMLVR